MALTDLIPLGPTGLPVGVENAKLPAVYERAKQALAECARIDECKDWANKAEALASYFQQSKNEQMMKDCRRIQARAIERCGELLKQVESGTGKNNQYAQVKSDGPVMLQSRTQVATAAGLSERQKVTALRVVSVPKEQRDALIESENPPTVTQLAEQGKESRFKAPVIDLEGIDPTHFARATELKGSLSRLADFCGKQDPAAMAKAFKLQEIQTVRQYLTAIEPWLDRFVVNLE
ncbi:MAG: hypothetical protein IPI57_12040 [Candidatus Competibacteraceae bacterium]|nr:hypothetical protein [Candidatus Competibacteraceae bacterium]